jgi:hypothetical protein
LLACLASLYKRHYILSLEFQSTLLLHADSGTLGSTVLATTDDFFRRPPGSYANILLVNHYCFITVGMMYCYCYLMKAANTLVTNQSHADSGELGSTVPMIFRRPPMLLYQSIFHSAHSHHSNRCEATQKHSIETRHGQRTRQKHVEEDGRWLRRKKRDY